MTIRTGEAELAIAGGTDAPITPHTVAAFVASGLTVPHNGSPESAVNRSI
jgi:3-oxoacyl-(acyl-carrier-protein) synthase